MAVMARNNPARVGVIVSVGLLAACGGKPAAMPVSAE